jgi:hypothetical protein
MTGEKEPCPPVVPLSTVDFVDRTLAAEIRRVEAVFKSELESRDKAHTVQAMELSRRLDELNHAHQRSNEDKAEFLPRMTYDTFLKGYEVWSREVNAYMANQQGRTAAYVSIVGVVFIVVQILLKFWK